MSTLTTRQPWAPSSVTRARSQRCALGMLLEGHPFDAVFHWPGADLRLLEQHGKWWSLVGCAAGEYDG